MNKITFCAKNITVAQQKVLESLKKYTLKKITEEIKRQGDSFDSSKLEWEINIVDTNLYDEVVISNPAIAFGRPEFINDYTQVLYSYPLKDFIGNDNEVRKIKKEVASTIDQLVLDLLSKEEHEDENPKVESCIEKNEIKFGLTSGDILITEEEATHLKKIKDIIGGGKMIITKGDLRIEIEE